MSFKLGNFAVKEIIFGVAQNFEDDILYTLDQLTSASIEISSDPTEITDKRGNVIRSVYNNKSGTFTATSALLSPQLMNAQTGKDAQYASAQAPIKMPRIVTVPAGEAGTAGYELDAPDAIEGTVHVIGIYNNGANGPSLKPGASAVIDKTFVHDVAGGKIIVPTVGTDAPTMYLVKYDRNTETGTKMVNTASDFPKAIKLTLYAAVMDPCSDSLRSAYIVIGSLTPDPSVTINLDAENQETDFSGTINVNFCSCNKDLYTIYLPDEEAVITATCIED